MTARMSRPAQSRSGRNVQTENKRQQPERVATLVLEHLEDRCVPATFTVTNLLDAGAGSLRQAILDANAAAGADTIQFDPNVPRGTITLTSGSMAVTGSVDIVGPGSELLTVDAASGSRIFNIDDGTAAAINVTISNMRLKGGRSDVGGAIRNAESLTISSAVVSANTANVNEVQSITFGGTVSGGTFTLTFGTQTTSDIAFNATASQVSSALQALSDIGPGNVIVTGGPAPGALTVTFTGALAGVNVPNLVADGTGLTGVAPTVAVNSVVAGVPGMGGGIYNTGTLTIQSSTISNNTAALGGGVYNDGGSATIQNSSVAFNGAGDDGGGVYNANGGTLLIEQSLLLENIAVGIADPVSPEGRGGGLANDSATATVRLSVLSQNQAGEQVPRVPNPGVPGMGGAIANFGTATLTVESSVIETNVAIAITETDGTVVGGLGGGIFNTGGATFTLDGTTISTNRARRGGGIHNSEDDPPVIQNSTISGNSAIGEDSAGGGILGLVDVFNSTIAFNSAGVTGGGMDTSGSVLTSTIVSNNSSPTGPDVFGDITARFSLIGNPLKTVFNPGSQNNYISVDPLLGALANNGGPTAGPSSNARAIPTHALQANSPAIDTGANTLNLTTDQRGPGFVRTAPTLDPNVPVTDIGAFEFLQVVAPTATITSAPGVTNADLGAAQYTFTITYADNQAVNVGSLDNFDVRVTGPGQFDQLATLVSVDNGTNGTPRVATYRMTPPGGTWSAGDEGVYTISIEANQVTDLDGIAVQNGSIGTFNAVFDVLAPTAALTSAPNVGATDLGVTQYDFVITFTDDTAINVATLDAFDVRVTGPAGFSQLASLVSVNDPTNGSPRVATYRITPPGGSWDGTDNGSYTVSIEAGQVTDTAGQAVLAGNIGSFAVSLPFPSPAQANGDLVISGTGADDVILITPGPSPNTVNVNANGVDLGNFTVTGTITVNGLDGNDWIQVAPSVKVNAVLNGNAGNDTLLGGGGNDQLIGGAGDDTYAWQSTDAGVDSIHEDFNSGLDTIDLSAIAHDITFGFFEGFDVPSQFSGATFELDNVERILAGSGNDVFIFGDRAQLGRGTGTIDGNTGRDFVDYSRYTSPITFVGTLGANGYNGTATGLAGFLDIDKVVPAVFQPNTIVPPEADPPGITTGSSTEVNAPQRRQGASQALDAEAVDQLLGEAA